MFVPSMLLKQLYTFGSLENTDQGVQFAIKNRLADATFTGLLDVKIDGTSVANDRIKLHMGDGEAYAPDEISSDQPIDFPLRRTVSIVVDVDHLDKGKHEVEVVFRSDPFGELNLKVEDSITEEELDITRIPRDEADDYSEAIIQKRQAFVEEFTG